MGYNAKIIAGGKVAVPAELRRQLGLKAGDILVFERDGNGMTLRSFDAVVADVQDWARRFAPARGLASDELIADRRAEAAHEAAADAGDHDR